MKALLQPEMMHLILGKIKTKGYIGAKEIESISSRLRIPSSRVYGFVSQFDELPQKPYRARIRVCSGPACADAGAWAILEDLKDRAPVGVEVMAEPGILRWHRSPAVCLEIPGDGARLAEGLGPEDITALIAALEKNDLSSYKLLKDVQPPGVEALPGHKPAPWWMSVPGSTLPDSWGPDLIRRVSDQPEEVLHMMVGKTVHGESRNWDGPPLSVLICDAVGPEPENSVNLAATLLHPRAVVAGAAIAASACGARRLLFYFPWNETEAGEALESAAEELLSGVGIKHSVFRGPAHIPCTMDIGRAAVTNGMMLWHAASLYGWKGTLSGDPSLAVLDAELAWRLPWLAKEGTLGEEWEESRLGCFPRLDGTPRLLEIPPGVGLEAALDGLGMEPGKSSAKAVYAGGATAAMAALRGTDAEILGKAGEIVLLDVLTCMPRWALYLAWYAERACCGGCIPGRTAPAAAGRLIQDILRAEAGETTLEDLESLLADASELALCPRLRETLNPILDCLREFGDEFEVHAKEGVCRAGSCAPAVDVATYGG
jgi:hypothetical protein